MLHLLLNVLVGNYDGAVFRYLLLVCDVIDQVEWQRVEDFRAFAAAIYPFLNVSYLYCSKPSLSEKPDKSILVVHCEIKVVIALYR